MAGRADLDLYNVLLGFGWARERVELVKATLDPSFLVRVRRAFEEAAIEPELIVSGATIQGSMLDATPFVPAIDAVTELPTPTVPSAPIADAIRALAAPGVTHLLVTTGPA